MTIYQTSIYDYDPVEPKMTGPIQYYSEQVIDHFQNPRNVGELTSEETDGYAKVGDAGCGDEMELWLSIRDGRIAKIAFKSFGVQAVLAAIAVYERKNG